MSSRRYASEATLQPLLREVLADAGYEETSGGDWSLWWPASAKRLEARLAALEGGTASATVAAIAGLHALSNGRALWANLCLRFGRTRAGRIMPQSFVPDLPRDRAAWLAEHAPGRLWLEKDIRRQRREGVWLIDDPATWEPADGDLRSRLIQAAIPDVLAVVGSRQSVRVWTVVRRDHEGLSAFVYPDGPVAWAEPDAEGAAGWLTRGGPLHRGLRPATIGQLLGRLHREGRDVSGVWKGCARAIGASLAASLRVLKTPPPPAGRVQVELFGVDFVLDEQLHPWLLEWNRRPRLTPHGPDDVGLRRAMLQAVVGLCGGDGPGALRPVGRW